MVDLFITGYEKIGEEVKFVMSLVYNSLEYLKLDSITEINLLSECLENVEIIGASICSIFHKNIP